MGEGRKCQKILFCLCEDEDLIRKTEAEKMMKRKGDEKENV